MNWIVFFKVLLFALVWAIASGFVWRLSKVFAYEYQMPRDTPRWAVGIFTFVVVIGLVIGSASA